MEKRILTTVPDLEEISTAAISICLWNCTHKSSRICDAMPLVSASVKKLPLPGHFIKLIEKYVVKVKDEMSDWVNYHYRTTFLSRGSNYDWYQYRSISRIRIVWYSNGTINYKQTAVNLQNSPRLSDVEKYRLLCAYCLQEEIELKWPVLFEYDAFDDADGDFASKYPLIQYWNSYYGNALDQMPVTEGMSLDSFMFQHENVDNWHAKEYFFDRMNVEEKMRYAVAMVEKAKKFPWQREMLLKLNETQRIQLYVERPAQVMANYVTHDSVEDALSAWFIIRDLINAEQFVTVIGELCELECDACFVIEVWRTASSAFKHHLLGSVNNESFKIFWKHCIKGNQFESYSSMLDTSEDIKKVIREKKIFRTHCKKLIDEDEIPLLERLLNFCFRNDEQLTQFKHRHMHSSSWFLEHCVKFVQTPRDYNTGHLKQLFELCFCDSDELFQFGKSFTRLHKFPSYCKRLIATDRAGCSLDSSASMSLSTLERLLNVCLPRTEDSSQFKRDFAENIYTLNFFEESVLRSCTCTSQFPVHFLQELCDLFPCPVDKLARLKRDLTNEKFFLDRCISMIKNWELKELQEGLNYFFDTPEQSEPFRRKLINQEGFFSDCEEIISHPCFSVSKWQILMDLITFEWTTFLPAATRESLNKFKKQAIFSPPCVSILRHLVENDRFNEVGKFVDGFLVHKNDKEALRLKFQKVSS